MVLYNMRNFLLKLLSCITITLFSCKNQGPQTGTKVYGTATDTVVAKETTSPTAGNYRILDLTPELKHYLAERLEDARKLSQKYHHGTLDLPYAAESLDEVLENWRQRKGAKEKPEYVIEALGFAFGQGLVDSLQMEWKTWSDAHGEDLTVINKRYLINAFPLSSAEKAYTENKVGSFQSIRTILVQELKEAEKSGQVKERR